MHGLQYTKLHAQPILTHHYYVDMGANPQSSIGTAFAFSRPSKEALLLSNTSLLLEYTSRVFLDSLQE